MLISNNASWYGKRKTCYSSKFARQTSRRRKVKTIYCLRNNKDLESSSLNCLKQLSIKWRRKRTSWVWFSRRNQWLLSNETCNSTKKTSPFNQQQSRNHPTTKTELVTQVNTQKLLTSIRKCSILNVAGCLDLLLVISQRPQSKIK